LELTQYSFTRGVIFITGTNGKTTSCKILTDILKKLGFKVLNNSTGGNILRSILGFFLISYQFFSKNVYDFLILEVDEGSLDHISKLLKPDTLVILNFSRDQLDRYFEIENITDKIINFLRKNKNVSLVFNHQDFYCLNIAKSIENKTYSFEKDTKILKHTSFNEEFMAENLDAVSKVLLLKGISRDLYVPVLKSLKRAYGRGERVSYKNLVFNLNLVKNPSSFNRNLFELSKNDLVSNVLIILNDEIPDGTDISWIYDIDQELLDEVLSKKNLYFSGKRAFEMATRVKYAVENFNAVVIDRNLKEVIKEVAGRSISEIYVLCNYSSMLDLRKILTGRKIL
jgi:UDP-N-acetylmuramyl tripeptide synthase